jgi:anti-anti-sigma factor
MEMTILVRDDGITHLVLVGRLDTNSADQMDKTFSDAVAAGGGSAIVDLSQIDFIASRGIGLLVANGKRLLKAGRKLVLLNPQGMVGGVLKTARAELLMPIVRDLDEALHVLSGGKAKSVAAPVRSQPRAESPGADVPVAAAADVLKLSIKNELSQLETVNAAVAEYLAAHPVPERAAYAVNLAIEELIVNVLQYAYIDDDPHVIEIELAIEGNQIVLRIVDDGMPFDPRKGPALNVHAEDYENGGLGLILVLDMVDVLKYRRDGDRNRVEVRIHLANQEEESSPESPAE